MSNSEKSYTIAAVSRALELLKLYEYGDNKLSLADISERLMLNKSTTFRLATTLCEEGFLKKDPVTGMYSLGLTICKLGSSVFESLNIREIALPTMQSIANQTGLVSYLAVPDGMHRAAIAAKVVSMNNSYVHNLTAMQGGTMPLHATGIGKILLANLSHETAREILESEAPLTAFTSTTITDIDVLMRQLPEILKNGYATSVNEHQAYASSVACPLYDYTSAFCGAVSIGGVSEMCADIGIDKLIEILKKGAREISSQLGYRGE